MASALKICATSVDSFFNSNIYSMDDIAYTNESLCKFQLSSYFEEWFAHFVFPSYNEWKSIVNQTMNSYCACNLNLDIARNCLANISPWQF